ncbi:MAG TPA: arsenic resistance N-acetyltransferase ArsN2 [Trinickia sp.]|uniref:arsenic resistance N-acetyltransferase ArsN2 n=1 Tax=Trinickia sp. TaxID=2571163 RepID=UPI002D1B2CE5|nr:arsenic resistance N-acetyltransferase ArsN2 [Trinickia sp.]HVW48920.1 arsenic resistance N-acetyltransferase ArsN2 [Trinickia sp.]
MNARPAAATHGIRAARPDDFPAIRALLVAHGLPADDVTAGDAKRFYVATASDDTPMGCAAIEPYGADALLRSVAVATNAQRMGLGAALVGHAQQEAERCGAHRLFLLTTSASGYFADMGYRVVSRSDAPVGVRSSAQFASLCPASAVCMMKALGADGAAMMQPIADP